MTQGPTSGRTRHRADYTLERGIWRAICRECGWQTSDRQRRQAATLFRVHIQDARELIDLNETDGPIDLATPAAPAPSPDVHPQATQDGR